MIHFFKRFFRPNIGIDIVDISRFQDMARGDAFIKKVFTEREIAYCFAFDDFAPHLAGIFAAKEAAAKALGTAKYPFFNLEIGHSASGAPLVYMKEKRLPVRISITHSKQTAIAVALA